MCGTVWFFPWVNTHPFDLKFVAFCLKFSVDSYVEFQEKTILEQFFKNFVQTKAILCQGWKEGSFVCETVCIFSWVNTHAFDLKFVAFCPKFSADSKVDFQEKNYFGTIFQKFCAHQGHPLPKLVKFRPTFYNFIPGPYCVEKIHTSTFICCLHPGEEARP